MPLLKQTQSSTRKPFGIRYTISGSASLDLPVSYSRRESQSQENGVLQSVIRTRREGQIILQGTLFAFPFPKSFLWGQPNAEASRIASV